MILPATKSPTPFNSKGTKHSIANSLNTTSQRWFFNPSLIKMKQSQFDILIDKWSGVKIIIPISPKLDPKIHYLYLLQCQFTNHPLQSIASNHIHTLLFDYW